MKGSQLRNNPNTIMSPQFGHAPCTLKFECRTPASVRFVSWTSSLSKQVAQTQKTHAGHPPSQFPRLPGNSLKSKLPKSGEKRAKATIHMVGMVFESETRQAVITSRIEGRLDEVYVNFTGERVNKSDPLVKIWSPTLIKSQVELFETIKTDPDDQSVIKGAEEKLIQYGLDREQIDQIRAQKRPTLYVTLKAPITGIVTKKNAILGQFVKEGTEMFVINDLSDVWVKMDAYETDLPWIRYGQNITFTTSAVPGKIFHGKVLS